MLINKGCPAIFDCLTFELYDFSYIFNFILTVKYIYIYIYIYFFFFLYIYIYSGYGKYSEPLKFSLFVILQPFAKII